MKDNDVKIPSLKDRRRYETRKGQRDAEKHFSPRRLARGIIHSRLKAADVYGVNQVKPGTIQSPFARNWREEADSVFGR